MQDRDFHCVQTNACGCRSSVERVANNRKAFIGSVHPNLMRPSRDRLGHHLVAADMRRLCVPGSAGIPAGELVLDEPAGGDPSAPRPKLEPPYVGCYDTSETSL